MINCTLDMVQEQHRPQGRAITQSRTVNSDGKTRSILKKSEEELLQPVKHTASNKMNQRKVRRELPNVTQSSLNLDM